MITKKKVLFIASEFASGMIPFAAKIINTLANDGRFEIYALCVCSGNQTYRGLIDSEAHPFFVDYPTAKWEKMIFKIWPFRIIKQLEYMQAIFKPDTVHYLTGDFTLANYVFYHHQANICYTVHDMHPHEVKLSSFLERILFRLITRGYRIMRDSANNLTTSSYTQLQELKKMYPLKNIEFTPFPSLVTPDIEQGGQTVRELVNCNRYILFFGSVQEYKGVQLLIDAYNQSALPGEMNLVIAGKGIDLENMNGHIIRINRFIDDHELRSLFERAEAVIYPYLSATMSGVLSIAYYFKKKVILSDIPYFRDNKTKACTFFHVGNIDDLTQKLNELLSDNSQPVEDSGYEELYSDKAMSDAYYNFYNAMKI